MALIALLSLVLPLLRAVQKLSHTDDILAPKFITKMITVAFMMSRTAREGRFPCVFIRYVDVRLFEQIAVNSAGFLKDSFTEAATDSTAMVDS
jgi:hypothetical protein